MDFDLILKMQEEEYRVPTEIHQMKKAAKPRGLTLKKTHVSPKCDIYFYLFICPRMLLIECVWLDLH